MISKIPEKARLLEKLKTRYQRPLSKALQENLYQIDIFLTEADTLLAKDKFRINSGSHDVYGIASIRNPIWSAYWHMSRHDEVVNEFMRLGFRTEDVIGIDIDAEGRPIIFRH